jgi:hypothetical protein
VQWDHVFLKSGQIMGQGGVCQRLGREKRGKMGRVAGRRQKTEFGRQEGEGGIP